jgi:hypothetical protein
MPRSDPPASNETLLSVISFAKKSTSCSAAELALDSQTDLFHNYLIIAPDADRRGVLEEIQHCAIATQVATLMKILEKLPRSICMSARSRIEHLPALGRSL